MGAIAEAIVAYAQPLIDVSDGSMEQVQKAMSLGQLCWNLAIVPDEIREATIRDMQSSLQMDDAEFAELRLSIIAPMIQRHHEMFPHMGMSGARGGPSISERPAPSTLGMSGARGRPSVSERPAPPRPPPATGPYEPCPCGSGRKYKFCCKRK